MSEITLVETYEQTRSLVIEELRASIRRREALNLNSFYSNIARLAVKKEIVPNPDPYLLNYVDSAYRLPSKYKIWIEEIVWNLIVESVVCPGLGNDQNTSLPLFRITEYGKKFLENQPSQPYDPDGFLARVKTAIPHVDTVILTYLEESLKAFRIHCLLSSVITLGCASEKSILLLIDACENAISNPTDKADFAKKTDTISIKQKHSEFQNILKSKILPTGLPKEIKENLEHYLNGMFNIIRVHRNESGHPSGTIIEREVLYSYLVCFPKYLEKVYSLIDWLGNNSI